MDSILNLKAGMQIEIRCDAGWKLVKVIQITMFNDNWHDIFITMDFDDGSHFTIRNDTPLKYVWNNIRLPVSVKKENNFPSRTKLTIPDRQSSSSLTYVNKNYNFNPNKECPPYKLSSITSNEDDDFDIPELEIELYHESFGEIYAVDKNGNRK